MLAEAERVGVWTHPAGVAQDQAKMVVDVVVACLGVQLPAPTRLG
jgi:hypothetical protein